MMFFDGEIHCFDYNTIKTMKDLLEKYGNKSVDDNGNSVTTYEDSKIKIEKVDRKISVYVKFHEKEKWHLIWDNINDQLVHSDFTDYIKKLPEIEKEKREVEESKEKYDMDSIIKYLGDYEDAYLKINIKNDAHIVSIKENDNIVYNSLTGGYLNGDWEKHILNIYKAFKQIDSGMLHFERNLTARITGRAKEKKI